jgi:hypothetical protein
MGFATSVTVGSTPFCYDGDSGLCYQRGRVVARKQQPKPSGGQGGQTSGARPAPPRGAAPPSRPVPPPARVAIGNEHEQTRQDLFARPTRKNIPWNDFLALMNALGAAIKPPGKGGSAHGFTLKGHVSVFHKPHPGNELPEFMIKRIRRFLLRVGEGL